MASFPWLKLYIKASEDMKLRTLTDNAHRVWYQLLCLAGDSEDRGTVDVSHRRLAENQVGKSWEEIESALEELTALKLVEIDGEITEITISNWEKYQGDKAKADTRKRVAKSRAKKKETPPLTSCNTDVTEMKQECNTNVTLQSKELRVKNKDKERRAREEFGEKINDLVHDFVLGMGNLKKQTIKDIVAVLEEIPPDLIVSIPKLKSYFDDHINRPAKTRIRSDAVFVRLLREDIGLFTMKAPPPPCTSKGCENGFIATIDEDGFDIAVPCPVCNTSYERKVS